MRPALALLVLGSVVLASFPVFAGEATATAPTFAYSVHAAPNGIGAGAGEPSLGVNWATGNVFIQRFEKTFRVAFDDATLPPAATWQDRTPPTSVFNVDPILFTDATTGRTFAGGLNGQCSILAYTDDDGESWTPMTNACASPAFDHETIGSGPWRDGVKPAGATHDRAVYYCAQLRVAQCARSLDGGVTFGPGVPVICGATPGLHGSVHVGADGYVYLPFKACGGPLNSLIGMSVSADNGLTWAARTPGIARAPAGFDPDVATTPSGWVYLGYQGTDGGAYAILTKTKGLTWGAPVNVGASVGVVNSTFHEMVAGDDDRAALAFLGTTTPGDAFAAGFTGTWDLYVATTLDAGATWTTVKVTEDPVQRGWICASGTTCSTGRNLLDFMDAQVDADGRVVIGLADGCIGPCAEPSGTAALSGSDYATIARQACGPSLFAAKGSVEGARPCDLANTVVVPPSPLTGTWYAHGPSTLGNTPGPNGHFNQVPPTSSTPRVKHSIGVLQSQLGGYHFDADFVLPAPPGGWDAKNVSAEIHLWASTDSPVPQQVEVAIYDASTVRPTTVAAPLAVGHASLSAADGVKELVITVGPINATLTAGFGLVVADAGFFDVVTFYDSVDTPTHVVFSLVEIEPAEISGTYYFGGVTPSAQVDTGYEIGAGATDTLRRAPPTSTSPRASANADNGGNAQMFYFPSWSLAAPAGGMSLDSAAEVRVFVRGAPATYTVTAYLLDMAPSQNGPLSTAFATKAVTVSPSTAGGEVVLSFPAMTRTLTQGLTVTVKVSGAPAGTVIEYDSVATPSRVVFG